MRSSSARPKFAVAPLSEAPTPEFVQALLERRAREAHCQFVGEGVRLLAAATESARPISGLIVSPPILTSDVGQAIVRRLESQGVPVNRMRTAPFRDLARTGDAQGIIVVMPTWWEELPHTLGHQDLWLGLDHVQTPGNLGTLLRSAEAAGATGMMAFDPRAGGADPFDPGAVRGSMGSLFAHRFIRTCHRDFRKWRKGKEIAVLGATAEGAIDFRSVDYRRNVVLLLGEERKGLSDGQRQTMDTAVRIPMRGRADSLNLAMAGTLILFEAMNQRFTRT